MFAGNEHSSVICGRGNVAHSSSTGLSRMWMQLNWCALARNSILLEILSPLPSFWEYAKLEYVCWPRKYRGNPPRAGQPKF